MLNCLVYTTIRLPSLFHLKIFLPEIAGETSAFKKLTYAEKDSEKWQKVFNVNFMISEESDVDGDDAIQI